MRRIVDLLPLFSGVLRSLVDRVEYEGDVAAFERALIDEPRLVVVLNHGPAHVPVIPIAALGRAMMEHEGARRVPIGITFRGLYLVPGLRRVVGRMTQAETPPTFDELLEGFLASRWDSVVIMPEGANCAFGDPEAIRPFASPRFVELATRLDAPIVLAMHRGLEGHAVEVLAPPSVLESPFLDVLPYGLGDALRRAGSFALPVTSRRIPELRMRFEIVRPSLDSAAFEALGPVAKKDYIAREAERIHATMGEVHRAIREPRREVVEDEAEGPVLATVAAGE